MARILSSTPADIAAAAEHLRSGGLVGMPTETVYGLAGNVFDEGALARIFETKERPTFDPLIVHVGTTILSGADPLANLAAGALIELGALSPTARERATRLIHAFWPGPLTLVLPKHARVPDLATSGLATVGLRLPRHPVAQRLIAEAGMPLAAPSANRFGRISPTTAAAVEAELGQRIELIVDGGPCEVGVESTVVSVHPDGELRLLRPGGITREAIAAAAGVEPAVASRAYAETLAERPQGEAPEAPGQLESHYAPRTPFFLLRTRLSGLTHGDAEALKRLVGPARPNVGLLVLSGEATPSGHDFARLTGFDVIAVSASAQGDPHEVARHLFHCLRTLDQSGAKVLFSEPAPGDQGLWHAIGDRLARASFRKT